MYVKIRYSNLIAGTSVYECKSYRISKQPISDLDMRWHLEIQTTDGSSTSFMIEGAEVWVMNGDGKTIDSHYYQQEPSEKNEVASAMKSEE